MANRSDQFPYKFKDLSQEEAQKIEKHFKGFMKHFVRVEPLGYLMPAGFKENAGFAYNMPVRPTDVFVTSFQRSGTTWTQELVWLVVNDFNYDEASKTLLTKRYPFLEVSMYMESETREQMLKSMEGNPEMLRMLEPLLECAHEVLATAADPRFVKTHLPLSLLPPTLLDTSKVVYVARDPRDVVVSSYHHARLFLMMDFNGDFKDFWYLFINDQLILTPYFEHVKESWNKRHHPNMLFLFYEELKKDLPATVRRVTDFFGKQITEEQMSRLCQHLSFDNFKNNKSVNFEDVRPSGTLASDESFIRKGKVGGWRDYFDEEMEKQAERWMADNLRDTDLRFPHLETVL